MNFLLFGTISLLVIWGLGHLYSDVRRVRDWQIASRQAKNLAIDAQSTSYDGLISAVAEGASGIGVKTAVHSGEASSREWNRTPSSHPWTFHSPLKICSGIHDPTQPAQQQMLETIVRSYKARLQFI